MWIRWEKFGESARQGKTWRMDENGGSRSWSKPVQVSNAHISWVLFGLEIRKVKKRVQGPAFLWLYFVRIVARGSVTMSYYYNSCLV